MSAPARSVGGNERRLRLATRHHLARAGSTLEGISADLVGYHASDPASVYLSALARYPGLTIASMEDALYERRSLVKVLGMRRTMFVVPPLEAAIVDAACTRALALVQHRRLATTLVRQGVTADPVGLIARLSERIVADLKANGEATARELTRRLPELDIRLTLDGGSAWATEVGVASRLLFLLATDARIIRARPLGSWLSSQYRWAATEDWLKGALPSLGEAEARTELVKRWLRSYGPGTIEDLSWWTGLSKRAIRLALTGAGAVEVTLEGGPGWLLPDDVDEAHVDAQPWVAFLPALDPTVMGWRKRDWYLEPSMVPLLFDRNGNAGPTVWSNGRVVGGWGQRRDGSVAVELLAGVTAESRRRIASRARRLTDWFAGTVATPRFRTPTERAIAAA